MKLSWMYFSLLNSNGYFISTCSHKGAVAVIQPYIRVVGMEEANDAHSRGPAAFTAEEVLTEIIANAVQIKKFVLHVANMHHA